MGAVLDDGRAMLARVRDGEVWMSGATGDRGYVVAHELVHVGLVLDGDVADVPTGGLGDLLGNGPSCKGDQRDWPPARAGGPVAGVFRSSGTVDHRNGVTASFAS